MSSYYNTIKEWSVAFGIFFGICLVVQLFRYLVVKRLKVLAGHTTTGVDDFLIEVIRTSLVPALYFVAAYAGMKYLQLPEKVYNTAHTVLLVMFTFFVLRIITSAMKFFVFSYLDKKEDSEIKKKQANGILVIVNVIVWILGFVFLLDNMGRDVTALIAGLGVGGIAIALAAQAILGDLFSYFVIYFDRPFEIGDSIALDDKSGTVEYIGLKTTRIRTLTGDQLIVSNTNLTNSRVHNYKKMIERGVTFRLTVTYQTTNEQLEAIPGYIQAIIEGIDGLRFSRAHFSSISASGLDFDTLYYVQSQDYREYMDKQEQLYRALVKKFREEGIEFSYVPPSPPPVPGVKGK